MQFVRCTYEKRWRQQKHQFRWPECKNAFFIHHFHSLQGGLKTVIWSDLFQFVMMLASLVAVIAQGVMEGGGIQRVWQVAVDTGRVEWANWDPSPFVRNTSLGVFFGQFVLWGAIFSTHQTQVQRYCATKSLRHARW